MMTTAMEDMFKGSQSFYSKLINLSWNVFSMYVLLQHKLLNVITLGLTKSDDINQMITITNDFY